MISRMALKLATSALLVSLAAPATAQDTKSAIFLCYGVENAGRNSPRTGFAVVLRQTNPKEVDPTDILNKALYQQTFWQLETIDFEGRIFDDASNYWVEDNQIETAAALLGEGVPASEFEYAGDITASLSLEALEITWNYNAGSGTYDNSVSYKPSSKSFERYVDWPNEIKQDVWCEDPFIGG